MSTVMAELLAVDALRAYLLKTLPAKVSTINSGRAAVLKATTVGPYTVTGNISLGITRGSETAITLTTGSRTTAQLVTEINAAAVSGITASADSEDRLTITASAAPSSSTPSVVSLAASAENAAFGWDKGGEFTLRSGLVAPSARGVHDGEPDMVDLGAGFWVLIGKRSTAPRSSNIRDDVHIVTMSLEVLAAEPNGNVDSAHELIGSAVRAVREVIYEDRTLDGQVHITNLTSIQYEARTFRFSAGGTSSPLLSAAQITAAVHVFERS